MDAQFYPSAMYIKSEPSEYDAAEMGYGQTYNPMSVVPSPQYTNLQPLQEPHIMNSNAHYDQQNHVEMMSHLGPNPPPPPPGGTHGTGVQHVKQEWPSENGTYASPHGEDMGQSPHIQELSPPCKRVKTETTCESPPQVQVGMQPIKMEPKDHMPEGHEHTNGSESKKYAKQTKVMEAMPQRRKHDRFDGMPEEEVLKKTLPDHLAQNLDIVIIGINPGLFAAYKGHHYAGPGNHFWKCLFLSGLIPQPMTAMDDFRLIEYGIGFTNVVARCTKGSADLSRKELKEGAEILMEKLKKYSPKIAVFNGKGIYEVFSGKKNFDFGMQPQPLEGTNITVFVMPSSSARCAQLPRAVDKLPFYVALKKLRDHLCGQLPSLDLAEVTFPDLKLKVEVKEDPQDDPSSAFHETKSGPSSHLDHRESPDACRTLGGSEASKSRRGRRKKSEIATAYPPAGVGVNSACAPSHHPGFHHHHHHHHHHPAAPPNHTGSLVPYRTDGYGLVGEQHMQTPCSTDIVHSPYFAQPSSQNHLYPLNSISWDSYFAHSSDSGYSGISPHAADQMAAAAAGSSFHGGIPVKHEPTDPGYYGY